MKPTDILTQSAIATHTGLSKANIKTLRSRGNFPNPDGTIAGQPVWHITTVDAWLEARPGTGKPWGPIPQGTQEAKEACANWIDTKQLAQLQGIPEQTIRDQLRDGKLTSDGKIGRSHVWAKHTLGIPRHRQ